MTVMEHEDTKARRKGRIPTVAEYLTQQIALCGKSQNDIAFESGFPKPNIISMLKSGKAKLPIGKIAPVAKALGVDPVHLWKLAMAEYDPENWAAIEGMILRQPVLTDSEMTILTAVRQADVVNPRVKTDAERDMIVDVINKLKP